MADQEAKIDLGIAGLGPAEHIGRGGFADVYRAEQLSLRRTVAVKVLRAQASDPEAEARFERECHAIGAVSDHPHIVGVHEGGFTRNGRAYLVMEYLPGGSLYERLREFGPMPPAEIIDTAIKIGKALAVAHRTGVLHRDIKPANIMISAYGEPALGDFGIARIEGGHQTATGLVTASFAHAAPEVLEGQAPSAGADIYSLGSTIYELMTGRAPYFDPADESIWPLMKRILSEPMPTPESAGMSPQLGAVFTRATARNVADRYSDAEELVEDLTVVAADPRSSDLYPTSGADATTRLDDEINQLSDQSSGLGSRTLVGGTPLAGGFPADTPPVAKPDLTSVRPVETELLDMADVGRTAGLSNGPAATTMDLPRATAGGHQTAPTRSRLGAMMAVALGSLALAGAAIAGAWYWSNRDVGDAVATAPWAAMVHDAGDAIVAGPIEAGAVYRVGVPDAPDGSTLRLMIDGEPVGAVSTEDLLFEAEPGRHSVSVEVTTDGEPAVTAPLTVYGFGPTAPFGYQANLASIDFGSQDWAAAMGVFDRLVAEGHSDLELIVSDDFATLTPGYWMLYVPGFGDDAEAAEAYCARFDLAIPTDCFAGYLGPGSS